MKERGVNTGLRLSRAQFDKLDEIAKSLNISRNGVVALLIEGAEMQTFPSVSVVLGKNNCHNTTRLTINRYGATRLTGRVLEYLIEHGPSTVREIGTALGDSVASVRATLCEGIDGVEVVGKKADGNRLVKLWGRVK